MRVRVFRLPKSAYLAVMFLFFCTVPLALSTGGGYGIRDVTDGDGVSGFSISPLAVLLVIPVLAAVYIARTATIVNGQGIRVRALFGSKSVPWEQIRGLTVNNATIYVVTDAGALRLPCIRLGNLHEVAAVSDGRLPEIAHPMPKPAPSRRRR